MPKYDVIVVGLGPAGAIAAYELSRQGFRVLAIERSALPMQKACGGALSVRAANLIPFDLGDQIEQVIQGVRFTFRGSDPFIVESTEPIAYTTTRDRFDHFMVLKAQKQGAVILDETEVTDWVQEGREVTVRSVLERWRCRYLILADGMSGLLRRIGERGDEVWIGVESEIPLPEPKRAGESLVQIDLGSAPSGFGWLLPKKDHQTVGIAGSERKVRSAGDLYGEFIESQGILKEASGQQVHMYRQVALSHRVPLHEGNALWAGDAAGLIDPFSGEGLYSALLTGLIAAEVISNNILEQKEGLAAYTARILAETAEEFHAARRFARLLHRWPETSYRFVESHKWVAELYFEILQGRARYDHVWPIVRKEWLHFAWRHWLRPTDAGVVPISRNPLVSFWKKGSALLFQNDTIARYLQDRRAH
ncbi:MAG: NAD(P)/FAD-dependent oxidoreductase [Nitrospirae bacterium]|nr:NAD(P)/FAD-dependent oxidoreductase [Candidatus Manganitrophaceae bacterium]